MTINAPASLLLLLYELVAEEQGVPGTALRGTAQNDILKEYIARGNYIYPPRPSMRLTTDLFAYAAERIPSWNTISISGYHIREAGSTAVQELAFTLANGIAYGEAAVAAGLSPDEFGARLSFFFNAHNNFFQEVAKFRAARRLWATIMRDRFGATNPKAMALRFHAQTGGSTLTAQQPENNIVRVAIQALSAIAGGAQSLHTNGFDEALALPTERSARIALRTQQILAAEAGATDTADPLGGSYFIEELTAELEEQARELIERIDEMGGAVAAIEQGFVQHEIEEAAFRWNEQVESGERVIVGVNRFVEDDKEEVELLRIDPDAERRQLERTARVRAERNAEEAEAALAEVRRVAAGPENLLPPMREALRARVTIGEISNALRDEFGTFDAHAGVVTKRTPNLHRSAAHRPSGRVDTRGAGPLREGRTKWNAAEHAGCSTVGAMLVAVALATGVALATNNGGDRSNDVKRAIEGGKADNVILFLGDGMGESEITLARNYALGANGRWAGHRSAALHRRRRHALGPGDRPVEARLRPRLRVDRHRLGDRVTRRPTTASRRRRAPTRISRRSSSWPSAATS